MESATSPAVIVLLLAAAGAVLGAWWLSIRASRRFRDLVHWVESQHHAQWEALPGYARRFNVVGAVERLRRKGLGEDPEFAARYREAKRHKPLMLVLLAAGMACIGAIPLGARFLGWIW